ncbi:MAG TPA: hypothetical protein VD962_02450 [Rubricoccaceae bacterium]|nr:hypothetical protein [Rubricoccaceae bacterium]
MTPEEFERLKEEEKAHLRQLRALKQQYRQAQRQRGMLDALEGISKAGLDDTYDEMLDRLNRQNIEAEARFEVALENRGLTPSDAGPTEAEREAMRRAEAEALVRQMKSEIPEGSQETNPTAGTNAARAGEPSSGKTIGRAAPPEPEAPPADDRGAKTIGRPRSSESGNA